MKIKYIILFTALMMLCAKNFAQKSGNNWFFGNRSGLSFNTIPPTPLTNGQLVSTEGSSAISDPDGNILFYSNGVEVYNRKHAVMKNGNNLIGHLSSTCNSIITPMPGHDSLYYLFTVSAAGELFQTFSYSVINIKRDGGLGEVVQKNVYVNDPVFEKVAAVRHCNKRDVWIIIQLWGTDEYHAYLLTDAGLSTTPVISRSGLIKTGNEDSEIGVLKFNGDGTLLAGVYSGTLNTLELMRFDNFTGQLSAPISFDPSSNVTAPGYRGSYGVEFSPNNKVLYVSSNLNPAAKSVLYQFDISLPNAAAIMASRVTISQQPGFFAGGLQVGPDKKIYFTMWKDSALSVINNPDVFGPGCNFAYNSIRVYGSKQLEVLESGLPGFVSGDLNEKYAPYAFTIARTNCKDPNASFAINYTADIDSVKWDFGDGTKSQLLAPTHTFPPTGTFTINVEIYRTDCSGSHATKLSKELSISAGGKILGEDYSLCDIKDVVIRSLVKASNYLWSTGAITDSILISKPGIYSLETNDNGCRSKDTIIIRRKSPLVIPIGNDTVVCVESPVTLRPPFNGYNYTWSTGETTSAIMVKEPGIFWLKFESNSNCITSDTIQVTYGNCEVYFPSAFTPNGDAINETFGLINQVFTSRYEIVIYDRWGQPVFHSSNPLEKWDGTSKNKKQSAGVYAWVMKYINKRGILQSVKGTVFLIR